MKRRFWYWITDALALLALLGVTVFVLIRWRAFPAQLPAHFGGDGAATNYGNKAGALLTPLVLSWVVFASMEVLSFFPQSWNVPRQTPRAYQAVGDSLAALRLILALLFAYLIVCTALCRGLGVWFLPAMLALVLGDVLFLLIHSFRR